MAVLLTLLLFFHVVGALAFIPGTVSLLKPRFPLPNRVMMWVLLATFGPALIGYFFFPEYVNLLTLAVLAVTVAVCEHLWATRNNVGMELRA